MSLPSSYRLSAVFTVHDIPLLLGMWAAIWLTAWIFDPSSLVLHLVTYASIAVSISAHYIWKEIREKESFHFRSKGSRRRASYGDRVKGS